MLYASESSVCKRGEIRYFWSASVVQSCDNRFISVCDAFRSILEIGWFRSRILSGFHPVVFQNVAASSRRRHLVNRTFTVCCIQFFEILITKLFYGRQVKWQENHGIYWKFRKTLKKSFLMAARRLCGWLIKLLPLKVCAVETLIKVSIESRALKEIIILSFPDRMITVRRPCEACDVHNLTQQFPSSLSKKSMTNGSNESLFTGKLRIFDILFNLLRIILQDTDRNPKNRKKAGPVCLISSAALPMATDG